MFPIMEVSFYLLFTLDTNYGMFRILILLTCVFGEPRTFGGPDEHLQIVAGRGRPEKGRKR